MKHHATADFWICYRALAPEVQQVADRAYVHLKEDAPLRGFRGNRAGNDSKPLAHLVAQSPELFDRFPLPFLERLG